MTQNTRPHERLEIDNFLVIKKAHFDVKAINVIIGEQASGKSLIAKILELIRSSLYDTLHPIFHHFGDIEDAKKHISGRVTAVFPSVFPSNKLSENFKVFYKLGEFEITIIEKNGFPKVCFNESLLDVYSKIKFSQSQHPWSPQRSWFIPASRSLVAIIQSNAATFMGKDFWLDDEYMLSFLRLYSTLKKQIIKSEVKENSHVTFKKLSLNIIQGILIQKNDIDYIKMEHGLIPFSSVSSGQQESVPMLLILERVFIEKERLNFFLEEPEAHLFPTAQKDVMSIIGLLYNQGNNFFLTTHSPYILVALNNLIMAGNVAREHPEKEADANAIIAKELQVNIDDVGAYTIENGELISIVNPKTNLIRGEALDQVSQDFQKEFYALQDIAFS